ncbi:aminotransferase class IV [Mucilaginibacter ginkgonis]|uniref:branched-chain-amino-acid transaminase n=1 Tax=Mucilaginibacter ginkgonis TaxID=2682091 RepID=A0A6I4I5J2_9SPHI|nr:aminotransferase class IV [Mucilaginibacter ginkgonis]QQL48441.1 aminotransferase class IV [Mucilaginibacter ginkgonis]
MKPLFIDLNGDILPADTKTFTAANRAFRYGDGLFESMRIIKGELKFADLHAARLKAGMKALKLDGYSQMDDWFIREKAKKLAATNKIKNGRLRLSVFRDAGGLYTPSGNRSAYILEIEPIIDDTYELNNRGLIMDVYTEVTKPINALSNFKTSNALLYVLAGIFKTENKLDEAFILNQNGFLCETISANLFVWYQEKLYTPALTEGCISGVMRNVVIKIAVSLNIPMVEAQINPHILYEADEVFITNASRGIQWVMGFGVKRYFNRLSKMLSDELNKYKE